MFHQRIKTTTQNSDFYALSLPKSLSTAGRKFNIFLLTTVPLCYCVTNLLTTNSHNDKVAIRTLATSLISTL
jgi:hypothetical protein